MITPASLQKNNGSIPPKLQTIQSARLVFRPKIAKHGDTSIYLVHRDDTQEPVIVKEAIQNDVDNLASEAQLMQRLEHPHIVKYYGHTRSDILIRIYMEYIEYSLETLLTEDKNRSEADHLKIAKGLAGGLAYLHGQMIVHSDVKPANVLASADYKTVKLCDFGLSVDLTKTPKERIDWNRGTPKWLAPEIAHYVVSTKKEPPIDPYKIDIWPLGQILLQLYINTGGKPYHNVDAGVGCLNLLGIILKGIHDDIPANKPLTPIVRVCLQPDPNMRPTAQQIVELLEGGLKKQTVSPGLKRL